MALPVNGSTHLIPALLLIHRPRKDERLSWPSWLTCSGWFTHISGHPSAAGREQDRESSPVRDRRSTTVLCHQLTSLSCTKNTQNSTRKLNEIIVPLCDIRGCKFSSKIFNAFSSRTFALFNPRPESLPLDTTGSRFCARHSLYSQKFIKIDPAALAVSPEMY